MNKKIEEKTEQFSDAFIAFNVKVQSENGINKKRNNGKELEQAHSMLFNITVIQCGSKLGRATSERPREREKRRWGWKTPSECQWKICCEPI